MIKCDAVYTHQMYAGKIKINYIKPKMDNITSCKYTCNVVENNELVVTMEYN